MIFELNKNEFYRCKSLLNGKKEIVEAEAVLEGNNPGWVFVDDRDNPKTAMVWSQGIQGFYFIGDHDNEEFNERINEFIDGDIFGRIKKFDLDEFEFSGDSEKWDKAFWEIFSKRDMKTSNQFIYRLNKNKWAEYNQKEVAVGYRILDIVEVINNPRINNKEFVFDEILRWWDSLDIYIEQTFGYCAVKDDEIVAFCTCDYILRDIRPLGIRTKEEHRRKGLCEAITAKFIERCVTEELDPYWDCMEKNEPSWSLAEKFGFERNRKYAIFWF